jgi:gas vesicle protein
MMRKLLAFLAGLIVGIPTGGMLALLLTPQPGPELRQQVQQAVERIVEEGRHAAEARRVEMEEQLESFKQGRPIVLQETQAEEA